MLAVKKDGSRTKRRLNCDSKRMAVENASFLISASADPSWIQPITDSFAYLGNAFLSSLELVIHGRSDGRVHKLLNVQCLAWLFLPEQHNQSHKTIRKN